MSAVPHLLRPVRAVAHRARTWPYLGRTAFALALIAMLLAWTQGHHLDHPADVVGYELQDGRLIAQQGVGPAGPVLKAVSVLLPYLDRWMLVGGAVYIFVLLRQWGNPRKLIFPTWVAAFSVALWAMATDMAQQLGNMQMTEMGEPPVMAAYWWKLVMMVVAMFCVPVMLHSYVRSKALDQYTLRTFVWPLAFCFIAFSSLWIIMDLLDNLKDFQDARISPGRVLLFYLSVIPFIFVTVMPASLLLAVLYTLTKMSRANEIVAMHTAGRSIRQVLRPIFIIVVGVCLMSLAANYFWAPRAEGNREAVVRALGAGQEDSIMASALMYRDPLTRRVWYVGSFPFSQRGGRERLRRVQVQEEDAEGRLVREIHADSASWWQGGIWRFFDGKEIRYQDGQPVEVRPFPRGASGRSVMEVRSFGETPWDMVSFALQPDFMGVPEIAAYLKAHPKDSPEKMAAFRTHLFHRFAQPWQSLALALVAAPLGIAYSRRGAVGGIAASIFIFFGILFLNNLFLNLGKGAHLPAALSPWVPQIFFALLGLVLLHYRSQNKDLPRFSFEARKRRAHAVKRSTPAPQAS